jgi:mitogen-activated protein kinase kinase
MQPPTESAEGNAPLPEESASGDAVSAITEDKEVAEWVKKQMQLKEDGLLHVSEKPALHAVALDKVGTTSSGCDPLAPSQND